jgi:hypothetical protein
MTERIRTITRSTIAESDHEHGEWLPAFWFISEHLFDTEFEQAANSDNPSEEDIDNAPFTAIDYAHWALYDSLMDASLGDLVIPSWLMDDQIEDWFVAQAFRRGLEDDQRAQNLNLH